MSDHAVSPAAMIERSCFWSGRSARSMPRHGDHTPGWSGVQPRRSPSAKSSANSTF
jgi:hypothetical protein